jgi:hypothetical protein
MKMFYKNLILTLILILTTNLQLVASGFTGGELSLKLISGNVYSVKLVVYKDCNSCQPPTFVGANYKCNTNSQLNFYANLLIVSSLVSDITGACSTCNTHCNNGNYFGLKSAVYMDTVTLAPGDWDIQVNNSYGTRVICANTVNSESWFMHCKLNNTQGAIPLMKYTDYPAFNFAINQKASMNLSAQIATNDSLVYSFYHPYKTNTSFITYAGSFTESAFINSSTPIILDSINGMLSFTPTQIGNYIVGVKCEQYHKVNGSYSKVATFFRESSVIVNYTTLHAPYITLSTTNAVIFNNAILYCQTDTPLNIMLTIHAHDLDTISPANKVFIRYTDSIQGANFLVYNNGTANAYALFIWQPTADDIKKNHSFILMLNDSACPYNLSRSYQIKIRFEQPPPTFNLGNDTTLLNTQVLFLQLPQADKYLWSTGDTNQMLVVADLLNYSNPIVGTIFNTANCSSSDSINVQFSHVGIHKIETNQCKIYPNPNKGVFVLELEAQGKQEYQIQIFDALGKEIYNQNIEFDNYKKLKIDLDSQPSGVYQLRIVSEKDIFTRRFIIR